MLKHYSAYFKRKHSEFVKKGIFDGIIGRDAKLHVDPLLLKNSKIKEFRNAYKKFLDYFNDLVILAPKVCNR